MFLQYSTNWNQLCTVTFWGHSTMSQARGSNLTAALLRRVSLPFQYRSCQSRSPKLILQDQPFAWAHLDSKLKWFSISIYFQEPMELTFFPAVSALGIKHIKKPTTAAHWLASHRGRASRTYDNANLYVNEKQPLFTCRTSPESVSVYLISGEVDSAKRVSFLAYGTQLSQFV